ncbi:MAG: hypothetical protein J6P19_01435 [Acetobacter sp.]|nr:hypothetical protein [Acetobacter sp.]
MEEELPPHHGKCFWHPGLPPNIPPSWRCFGTPLHDETGPVIKGNVLTRPLQTAIEGQVYYDHVADTTNYGVFQYNTPVSKPDWLQITQVGSVLEFKGIPTECGDFKIVLHVTLPLSDHPDEWDGNIPVEVTYLLTVVKELKVNYADTSFSLITGQQINITPTVSGPGGYSFSFENEAPGTLEIDPTTGKLTGGFPNSGVYTTTVCCTDSYQTVKIPFSFNVDRKLSISYASISAIVGEPINVQPTVLGGGNGTKTFRIVPSHPHQHISSKQREEYEHDDNPIPSRIVPIEGLEGLGLNTSTGAIYGIPLKPLNTEVKIECLDDNQRAVTSTRVYVIGKLRIRGHLHEQEVGRHFSFTPHTTGGIPSDYHFSYACDKELPKGLSFDTKNGRISGVCGTPVHDLHITIICTDANQVASLDVVLNVIHHENVHHRHHHDEKRRTREEKTEKRK